MIGEAGDAFKDFDSLCESKKESKDFLVEK